MELWMQVTITVIYFLSMGLIAVWPNFLGLGRPLIAMLGACACVFVQGVAGAESAHTWEGDIQNDVIFFLFGLMIISHYMGLTGFNRVLRFFMEFGAEKTAKSGPFVLLWIVSLLTAVIAIFFTNDMAVYLFTPEVVRLSRMYPNLRPSMTIFLMAIATSANIGATVSPIGSPQNALILAIGEGVTFADFWIYLSIPTVACLFLNTFFIHIWLWFHLRRNKVNYEDLPTSNAGEEIPSVTDEGYSRSAVAEDQPLLASKIIPRDSAHVSEKRHRFTVSGEDAQWAIVGESTKIEEFQRETQEIKAIEEKHEKRVMNWLTILSAFVFVAWIVAVSVTGVALGISTMLAAFTIMLAHSFAVRKCGDSRGWSPDNDIFRKGTIIDFGLLFLFQGMFILVGAFLNTGWPEQIFDLLLGEVGEEILELWFVMVLLFSVLAASNIMSNVPVIMLLQPLIQKVSDPVKGWMIMALATTLAGNLTLVGSAANLIVAERSRQIGGPDLTFFVHLPYGFPTTILFAFIGLLLLLWVY